MLMFGGTRESADRYGGIRMAVRSIRKAWRIAAVPLLIVFLSVIVACGGTASEPAAAPAAHRSAGGPAQAATTSAPEPTAMPAMADADSLSPPGRDPAAAGHLLPLVGHQQRTPGFPPHVGEPDHHLTRKPVSPSSCPSLPGSGMSTPTPASTPSTSRRASNCTTAGASSQSRT